jgi:hypothetical protein
MGKGSSTTNGLLINNRAYEMAGELAKIMGKVSASILMHRLVLAPILPAYGSRLLSYRMIEAL